MTPRPLGAARVAATCALLFLAAGCTPEHVERSATTLAKAATSRVMQPHATSGAQLAIALNAPPAKPFPTMPALQAEQRNAALPFSTSPIEAMRPFVLKTDTADRTRAVECLTQAVYYEAAREPLKGQQAIAQVVLNRVRHPAYPKSVCGVVYQGAAKATGCQFTFTCDGSLRGRPAPALWARAEDVAREALAGYVDKDVGSATHYHAAYVAPYWAPTLVKMTQVGQHIFYRWTGAAGQPDAFTGHYAGREAVLSRAVLQSGGAPTPKAAPSREVTLTMAGGGRTYRVADAAAPDGERTRVAGVLQPTRRAPTPDEVQRINAHLAAFEKGLDAPAATTAASNAAALAPG